MKSAVKYHFSFTQEPAVHKLREHRVPAHATKLGIKSRGLKSEGLSQNAQPIADSSSSKRMHATLKLTQQNGSARGWWAGPAVARA